VLTTRELALNFSQTDLMISLSEDVSSIAAIVYFGEWRSVDEDKYGARGLEMCRHEQGDACHC
jgi:hypothetical protein